MHINKDNHELVEEIKSVIDLRQSIELEINTIAQKTKISRGTIKNCPDLFKLWYPTNDVMKIKPKAIIGIFLIKSKFLIK